MKTQSECNDRTRYDSTSTRVLRATWFAARSVIRIASVRYATTSEASNLFPTSQQFRQKAKDSVLRHLRYIADLSAAPSPTRQAS
jgi:hypothetical protein